MKINEMTNAELQQEASRLTNLYNSSKSSWHRKCLEEKLEELEDVAAERGIEI